MIGYMIADIDMTEGFEGVYGFFEYIYLNHMTHMEPFTTS